jgi:hypothetical protein
MLGIGSDETELDFVCLHCGGEQYSVWEFPNVMILHWILNPGLMVNELLLGQRIPKQTYVCAKCGPWLRGQVVHCPACNRFHEGAVWSGSNALGHWLGLVCPDCGACIPSLLNLGSLIVLGCLRPITAVLRRRLQQRILDGERRRTCRSRDKLWDKRFPVRASSGPAELNRPNSPAIF